MSVSGFAGVRPPRDEVLLLGLVDWVPLERVHQAVVDALPELPLPEIQRVTLDLIGGLVREGLFEIGDLTAENARFSRWSTTLTQSLQRIKDAYVTGFDKADHWSWFCWLDMTPQGASVAQPVEDRLRGNRETSE